jgi:hypothetical protein
MSAKIPKTNKETFLNTVFWGFILWLIGYILGFLFFAFVPKEVIGWYILPIGVIVTLWVLFKKIERKVFSCYLGVSIFWTLIAIIFDYIFIVNLLNSNEYYKFDVYVYYLLTFLLPLAVGWYKFYFKSK